jgi:hypothetical protein
MGEQSTLPVVARHGAHRLPSVEIDSYNVELKDNEGFIGDRASRGAFRTLVDQIRKSVRKNRDDPLGDTGVIEEDGSIDRGAQNLPGNWESSKFNLPLVLHEMIPSIAEHEAAIVLHNDAVVQGLSEIPFMQDVERWGILTIGTGLGNARFTNRSAKEE